MSLVEILIADDHNLVRRGLRSLIETNPEWHVCGEAVNGKDAVAKARELNPDLVLMDVSMPEMNGLDATRQILQERPDSRVLIVSQNDQKAMENEAMRIGAKGFVHKSRISQELLGKIESLVDNGLGKPSAARDGHASDVARPANVRGAEEVPARILLADDDAGTREYVERSLGARYEIEPVANGEVALRRARESRPDLMLSDIALPGIDGFALLRAMRADPDLKDIPVVLLSAGGGEESRLEALEAGADDCLVKPFSARELAARVRSHLATARIRREAAELQRNLRAEALLERNRTREMLMQAPTAIGSLSGPEHRWSFVNAEYLRVTGRSRAEEFVGKTIRESLPELEGQEFFGLLDTVYRTGVPYVGTEAKAVLIRSGKGEPEEAYFNFVYQPLRDIRGQVEGILIHAVDVTHQVVARREIEKRERASGLLAAIVDSSDDAIVSKNLDGTITSWNKSAERLFGYTSEEVVGRHITLLIPRERWKEEEEFLRKIRRGERIDHFETVRVRKDGSTIDLSLTISPVKNAFGQVIGASKVARDISELKEVREERRQNQLRLAAEAEALRNSEERLRKLSEALDAEVRARTRELEERNADVTRQSEQLRELSWRLLRTQDEERRHIARELHDSAGQTLTVLGMNLAAMVQALQEKAPEIAKSAQQTHELAQQLTKEIRTTSYLLHPPLLDENGLADALSWYIRGLKERSGLDIAFRISEGFGRLPSDLELLVFRLVQECLTNIHRHSGSKNAVIDIRRDLERVLVEVRDQGKGISTEKLAEIQSRGSGVGIRGMQERLRQFQGSMTIESTSSGTATKVTIPLPKEPAVGDSGGK